MQKKMPLRPDQAVREGKASPRAFEIPAEGNF